MIEAPSRPGEPIRPESSAWLYGVALAVLALVMAWLYGEIDYLGEFAHVDLQHYRSMAQAAPGIDPEVRRPFAHRLLGPYLVGLLPFPDPLAFRLMSTSLLVATTLVFFGFLRRIDTVATPIAAYTAALFTLNPYWFGFIAFNPFQVADAIALICVVSALWAFRAERVVPFAILLLVGTLAREPVILVVPAVVAATVWRNRGGWKNAVRWAAAGIPALAGFILLRMLLPAPGSGFAEALLAHADKAFRIDTWFRLLINSYAPLSLLPLVFWQTAVGFSRRHPDLIVLAGLVLVSAFFGGDQERLMAPAFVTAYALVATLLARHMWHVEWARWLIAACAFAASLHHLTARFPLPSRAATMVIALIALVLVTGAALYIRVRSTREPTVTSPERT